MKNPITAVILICTVFAPAVFGQTQDNAQTSEIKTIRIPMNSSRYYIVLYKDTKPDDVPQEVYDGLWEIQKEVVDNFTYDFAVKNGRKKSPYRGYTPTKEDYYKHGGGVCDDYSNFFILLAQEKGITENLYKVSGNMRIGGHAWLEYHTEENVYIIDPTWSDDYNYSGEQTKQNFRESPAYGKVCFFTTYAEDKIIYRGRAYNHSSFTGKEYIPLWDKKPDEESGEDNEDAKQVRPNR